jgi:hypothetical protein
VAEKEASISVLQEVCFIYESQYIQGILEDAACGTSIEEGLVT